MPNDGKSLERLVALLERALGTDRARVESRVRLPDRITGMPREHDVLVTIEQAHHKIRIALECKDHARPVTVHMVEAFHQKCQDTGVQQGAIVSASGFAKTARQKAAHYGIRCLDIVTKDSFNWILTPSFHFFAKRVDEQHWMFFPEHDGAVQKENAEVLLDDGRLFSRENYDATARAAVEKLVRENCEPVEKRRVKVRVNTPGMRLRDRVTGATTSIRYAIMTIVYSMVRTDSPFQHTTYLEGNKQLTEVAFADVPVGRIALVREEDGGTQVIFQPSTAGHKAS